MTDAYVHITVEPGEITDVVSEVTDIEHVSAVHVVTGEYDVIAQLSYDAPGVKTIDILRQELDADPREEIPEATVEEIDDLDAVREVTLNLAFDPF